jgi:hypothetical protein
MKEGRNRNGRKHSASLDGAAEVGDLGRSSQDGHPGIGDMLQASNYSNRVLRLGAQSTDLGAPWAFRRGYSTLQTGL